MKVYYQLSEVPKIANAVITIGTFDGVHLGHRKIIMQLTATAAQIQGESVLVTFEPHPRMVINPDDTTLKILTSLNEKISLLSELGIHHLVIVPFTNEFRNLTAQAYIEDFLVKTFQPHTIILGYDHQFGKDRSGNYTLLQQFSSTYQYQLVEISKQEIDELTISSTTIRKSLQAGDLFTANTLLQQPYSITGTVIHGDARGRTIGYPTANINIHNSYKLIPQNGVYAVRCKFQGLTYGGMMNIGTRPTIEHTNQVSIEVHLFDFNKTIYDQQITVSLITRLRDEKKFNGLEELITAIKEDENNAKKELSKHNLSA
jgi:riboflavin kinase / FMN adenylyltransferase